jgi:hypothetical protein
MGSSVVVSIRMVQRVSVIPPRLKMSEVLVLLPAYAFLLFFCKEAFFLSREHRPTRNYLYSREESILTTRGISRS